MTLRTAHTQVDLGRVDLGEGTIYQSNAIWSTLVNTTPATAIMAMTLNEPPPREIEVRVGRLPSPAWLQVMIADINRAAELPEGWDSYGGFRLKQKAAIFAIELLEFMDFGGPAPWVSPTPDGGIHLEWDRNGLGLEIEVSESGDVEVLTEEMGQFREWDTDRFGDEELRNFLARVSDRP